MTHSVVSTDSVDDSLDEFFRSSGFPSDSRSNSKTQTPSTSTSASTTTRPQQLTACTELLGAASSSASSPLWFFSNDVQYDDNNEEGIEATATLTLQPDGYKVLPSSIILTTSYSYASNTPAFLPHLFPDPSVTAGVSLEATPSHCDEYGFPVFPATRTATAIATATSNCGASAVNSSPHNNTSSSDPLHHAASPRSGKRRSDQDAIAEQVIKVISLDTPRPTKVLLLDKQQQQVEVEHQEIIDCTQSSSTSSVSTMTKENNSHGEGIGSTSSSKIRKRPTATTTSTTSSKHQSTSYNHDVGGAGSGGIQKVFSKLALCGHSAKEEAMDLDDLVLALRQALTAEEATASLKCMVQVLKDARYHGTPKKKRTTSLSTSELQEGLVAAGADHCVISTQWNFPSNVPVQFLGIVALGELVAHSHLPNQKSIVLKGGIEVVLTAMKQHADHESIQEEACRTLKNIMKYYDQAKQHVARHNGITRILQAMMTHPEYATVQRQACYALTSLSCLKPVSDELVSKQGHAVLLKTMQHHNDDPYVLAEAWRTLTNIVIHAMNSTLDEEIAAHGMPLVFEAMHKFADCALVPIQARGLTLLTHLCYRSQGNLTFVTQSDHLKIIHHVLDLWSDDEKVQAAGDKLIHHIGQTGYRRSNTGVMTNPHYYDSNDNQNIYQGHSHSISTKTTSSSGSRRCRHGAPSRNVVIGQIRNDRGLDVIVDASMY